MTSERFGKFSGRKRLKARLRNLPLVEANSDLPFLAITMKVEGKKVGISNCPL